MHLHIHQTLGSPNSKSILGVMGMVACLCLNSAKSYESSNFNPHKSFQIRFHRLRSAVSLRSRSTTVLVGLLSQFLCGFSHNHTHLFFQLHSLSIGKSLSLDFHGEMCLGGTSKLVIGPPVHDIIIHLSMQIMKSAQLHLGYKYKYLYIYMCVCIHIYIYTLLYV